MDKLLQMTQIAANVATTIGVVGIFVAYLQFREGVKAQRQATALETWKDYLHLAIAHPELAFPDTRSEKQTVGANDLDRYKWFVSTLLFACEQVLVANPNDEAWRVTIINQLRHHRRYLSARERNFSVYEASLGRLIRIVVEDHLRDEHPMPQE
jgi:hypothetical protein